MSPNVSHQLQTSRRSAVPLAASARSNSEGRATERGLSRAAGDSTWCSTPVPAPEAVRPDGPHSRRCRARSNPGRLWGDRDVNYRFPPLRGFRHLPDMRTRRAPGGSSLSRRHLDPTHPSRVHGAFSSCSVDATGGLSAGPTTPPAVASSTDLRPRAARLIAPDRGVQARGKSVAAPDAALSTRRLSRVTDRQRRRLLDSPPTVSPPFARPVSSDPGGGLTAASYLSGRSSQWGLVRAPTHPSVVHRASVDARSMQRPESAAARR